MFQINVVEKIKTRIFCPATYLEKSVVYEIVWKKYGRDGQATDDNMARAHCML